MKQCSGFPTNHSPEDIEVFQLTEGVEAHYSHIYPESQIFTPDSTKLVLFRNGNPHGHNLEHLDTQYVLCDLASNGAISPLTHEKGASAPCISPDGKYFYYFVRQPFNNPETIQLKRFSLETGERETLFDFDGYPQGSSQRITKISTLATIRQDGLAIALPVVLGHRDNCVDSGLVVFDLVKGEANLIVFGPSWCNLHPQYCRSTDPAHMYDILIQENHGCEFSVKGTMTKLVGSYGCDIHLIRDDGSYFRTLAWGRDKDEECRGHQCWRGRSTYAIGSINVYPDSDRSREEVALMEGQAFLYTDHLGKHTPGASYNDLTRDIKNPRFDHFATDLEGNLLVSDGLFDDGWQIHLSRLGTAGKDPLLATQYLLHTRSVATPGQEGYIHPHPFFSPNGKMIFFNSNASGILHTYMARNLPSL